AKMSVQKAARNVEDSKAYLRNDFSQIAGILSRYNPLEVLKMALWEERRIVSLGTKDPLRIRSASLMPLVLQSVLQSKLLDRIGKDIEIKQKDWNRLKDLSEDVTRRMVRLIDSFVASCIGEGKVDVENAEDMRTSISSRLLPFGADANYLERSVWMLSSMLKEIPDFPLRTGVDVPTFVLNVQNIARMGLNGIDMLVRDVAVYREEYSLAEAQLRASGELEGLDEADTFNLITKKNHWEGRAKELSDRRDGYSLFMPETASSLPVESLLFYSVRWGSLDMESFLEKGFWPAERYPIVDLDGRQYSFVAKYLPSFISLSCGVDRFLSSSRDVLSIFHLSDCDTYVYDGNKVEISVLPGLLDVNPFLYPSSFMRNVRRRKEELQVKRELGHKKMVVDPDMEKDMDERNDVLFVSSPFLSRATVDKSAKRDLLSRLLGDLDLPSEENEFMKDAEDDMYSSVDSSQDDILDETTTDEYEYSDVDEDEVSKEIDEKFDNISLIEYEKKEPSREEKQSLIERYSLTDDIIRKSEEEEKKEYIIESALDDDIFDDTEEEERLDEIGGGEASEDSDFFDAAESSDEYQEEEKEESEENYGQLDFLSILDEEDPEEIEFDEELEKEDEESFVEEERKEEILDSVSVLPDEDEVPVEEEELSEDEYGPYPSLESEYREDIVSDTLCDSDPAVSGGVVAEEEHAEDVCMEETSQEPEEMEETVQELDEDSHSVMEDEVSSVFGKESDGFEGSEELEDSSPSISDDIDSAPLPMEEVGEEEEDSAVEDESTEESGPQKTEDEAVPDAKEDEKDDENTFIMSDDNSSLPIPQAAEEKKAPLDFIGSLFASVGVTDDDEDDDCSAFASEDETEEETSEAEEYYEEETVEETDETTEETETDDEPGEETEETEEESLNEDDPILKAKGVVLSIYNKLGQSSAFASFVSSSDQATLDQLDSVIRSCWNRQMAEGKDKLFNIPDFSLSILLAHDSIRDELRLSELLNNAGGVMYSREKDEWKAVIVYINSDFVVEEAIEKTITRSSFSPADWKRVTYIGEQMRRR
ncbi:MAG: hypothetical protein ACI4S4_07040, partial [Candidatus Ornithospirochaeta sp.]